SRRALVAACLRALYDRLHGPAADYSHNLTRDSVKELLLPVIREYRDRVEADQEPDEFTTADANDPQQLAAVAVRVLLRDGWLEAFPDRQGLVTAFRLTRPGKLFAEAFWSLQRPSRSRQRNMRSCRNALEAALRTNGDAHDLVDAYEYAEKVIEDLTEGIDFLQERVRQLMREATVHDQWDDFVEFLDKFQRDYSKQLTVDSATLRPGAARLPCCREKAGKPGQGRPGPLPRAYWRTARLRRGAPARPFPLQATHRQTAPHRVYRVCAAAREPRGPACRGHASR